jgi:hypothetical protein
MGGEAFDLLALVIKANRLQVPLEVDHDESRRIDEQKSRREASRGAGFTKIIQLDTVDELVDILNGVANRPASATPSLATNARQFARLRIISRSFADRFC